MLCLCLRCGMKHFFQGDSIIAEWMNPLGVMSVEENDSIILCKKAMDKQDYAFDFSYNPDLFPTMAATCAGLQLEARFTGIATLENKESDRILAMKMELAKMEAQYKAEIDKIGKERNRLAHEPVAREEQDSAPKPKELTLTLSEIVDFVKERFSRSGAAEMCTMLYGKAIEHNRVDEDVFKLIEGIVPAIIKRDKPQTNVDIKEASQVNINPQEVINHYTKGEG